VVWRILKYNELYADVLLVEHGKGFGKDNLREFYRKNTNRFRWFTYSNTKIWSLDDNTALMTTFKIMNGYCILNITISEVKKDNNTRTPVHIDLER
jgi:hypothetical protein